jgi:hypothetical protein
MAKVVQTLIDFGNVQKLGAHIRLHWGAENPRLTELAQVAMRRHLLVKIN